MQQPNLSTHSFWDMALLFHRNSLFMQNPESNPFLDSTPRNLRHFPGEKHARSDLCKVRAWRSRSLGNGAKTKTELFPLQKSKPKKRASGCEPPVSRSMLRCTKVSGNEKPKKWRPAAGCDVAIDLGGNSNARTSRLTCTWRDSNNERSLITLCSLFFIWFLSRDKRESAGFSPAAIYGRSFKLSMPTSREFLAIFVLRRGVE